MRKYLYGAEVFESNDNTHVARNLPAVAKKTVEQAERELIYRALLDLKADILELRDLVSGRPSPQAPESRIQHEQSNGDGSFSLDEMERQMIQKALNRHEGNRRLAARELNISERTLYRKIKEYGLSA